MTLGGDWLHKILSNDLFEKIGVLLEGTNLHYMGKCASNVEMWYQRSKADILSVLDLL